MQYIIFIIASLVTLGAAWKVVTGKNVFHNALFMILSFIGVAALYVLLEAGFLAVMQILIYVGAISILIIFAIMLSRRIMSEEQTQHNSQWWIAAIVSVALFLVLGVMLLEVTWPAVTGEIPKDIIALLGESFMSTYVLPFEVASVILLVALVGSIMIARER
jgi:NADH:ubiquinone oxidoreductase subunit 6 (subunit J)